MNRILPLSLGWVVLCVYHDRLGKATVETSHIYHDLRVCKSFAQSRRNSLNDNWEVDIYEVGAKPLHIGLCRE